MAKTLTPSKWLKVLGAQKPSQSPARFLGIHSLVACFRVFAQQRTVCQLNKLLLLPAMISLEFAKRWLEALKWILETCQISAWKDVQQSFVPAWGLCPPPLAWTCCVLRPWKSLTFQILQSGSVHRVAVTGLQLNCCCETMHICLVHLVCATLSLHFFIQKKQSAWAHPALAWIAEIRRPGCSGRCRRHSEWLRQGRSVSYCTPSVASVKLDPFEWSATISINWKGFLKQSFQKARDQRIPHVHPTVIHVLSWLATATQRHTAWDQALQAGSLVLTKCIMTRNLAQLVHFSDAALFALVSWWLPFKNDQQYE